MTGRSNQDRLTHERDFHDRLASALDPRCMPPGPLSTLDQALLRAAGDVSEKRVLDLGCGSGDLTFALARSGARTIALDLSAGMVDVARRRLELFAPGSEPEFLVAPAEALPIEDNTIDLIVGRFILHHLDIQAAASECARVLAPRGAAIFVENSGRNPLLMFARRRMAGRFGIPRYGTPDERPLSGEDLEAIRRHLPSIRLEYPVFEFFVLFDRQVLRYRWETPSRLLRTVDDAVWRWLPAARPWSFRVLVEARA